MAQGRVPSPILHMYLHIVIFLHFKPSNEERKRPLAMTLHKTTSEPWA